MGAKGDAEALCRDPAVKKELLAQLTATAKEGKLKVGGLRKCFERGLARLERAVWRGDMRCSGRVSGLSCAASCHSHVSPLLSSPPPSRTSPVRPPTEPQGFEQVRALYIESPAALFSVENDLLTPTFKMKRAPLQKRYQAEVDAMYAALKAPPAK